MIINELLDEKYKTQKKLDYEANHNLKIYVEKSHLSVCKLATTLGLKFKYKTPN